MCIARWQVRDGRLQRPLLAVARSKVTWSPFLPTHPHPAFGAALPRAVCFSLKIYYSQRSHLADVEHWRVWISSLKTTTKKNQQTINNDIKAVCMGLGWIIFYTTHFSPYVFNLECLMGNHSRASTAQYPHRLVSSASINKVSCSLLKFFFFLNTSHLISCLGLSCSPLKLCWRFSSAKITTSENNHKKQHLPTAMDVGDFPDCVEKKRTWVFRYLA